MDKFLNSSVLAVLLNKRLIIRAIITAAVLGMIVYMTRMLFFYKPSAEYKDIINVIIGAILGQLPTVVNFWFKKDSDDHNEDKIEGQAE